MSLEKVRAVAEKFQKNSAAPLGFAFKDLKSGEVIAYHGDSPFPTASSYKLYILAELFRQVYTGERKLSDRYPLTDDVKAVGSGVLQILDAGAELTLKDYATLMMTISDNTATDVLFNLVGRDNIKKNVIDALGLTNTKCDYNCAEGLDLFFAMRGRSIEQILADNGGVPPSYHNSKWYQCITPQNNQTSPLEALKMLEILYRGEWICPEASEQMLSIMLKCQTNSRIPRYLPPYQPVAHKTGTIDRLNVDIGIVYAQPVGDYIICMFYNGNLSSKEDYDNNPVGRVGDDYLAELSGEIFKAYME